MSHDHAHPTHGAAHSHGHVHDHPHGHPHDHAPALVPARLAADDVASVLMQGAAARLGAAAVAIALLWAGVAWALSDLTT